MKNNSHFLRIGDDVSEDLEDHEFDDLINENEEEENQHEIKIDVDDLMIFNHACGTQKHTHVHTNTHIRVKKNDFFFCIVTSLKNMITRSFSKRILRNVSHNYDKNQLYYSTKEYLESFYHIEQDFHQLLQKELQPIRGKEYYQSEEFVRIYQKARKRFSANYNIIHMKNHQKSQKLEFEKTFEIVYKKTIKE